MVPTFIKKSIIVKEEIINYTTSEYIVPLLIFLKMYANSGYAMLLDITAVDYPEKEKRFEVVYIFLLIVLVFLQQQMYLQALRQQKHPW